jgi:DNA-binding response OmpR family regulator
MSPPTEEAVTFRPNLIIVHADPTYSALLRQAFASRGWRVHFTRLGSEARCLARELPLATVILDADLPEESGWLTCAKLSQEQPNVQVVLVTGAPLTPERLRLATFVGASRLLNRHLGTHPLIEEICGKTLAVSG